MAGNFRDTFNVYSCFMANAIFNDDIDDFKEVWSPDAANRKVDVQCGRPILHLACQYDRADIIRFMLENGANPNIRNRKTGSTPMFELSFVQSIDASISDLMRHGADPFIKNNFGQLAYCIGVHRYQRWKSYFLVVELVCGEADNLPLDMWRVVKPFLYKM